MEEHTLILIDIQRGFLDPVWGPRSNPEFEQNVAQLLRAWRSRRWPVIHVRHNSTDPTSPLRPCQFGNEFMECAIPHDDEAIVDKTVHSAFIGTALASQLVKSASKQLLFAGLTADHCVSTSVRMAADLGFSASVVADATATFSRQDYEGRTIQAEAVQRAALASLAHEFANVFVTSTLL